MIAPAVRPRDRSIRMSSGSSRWNEKPRPAAASTHPRQNTRNARFAGRAAAEHPGQDRRKIAVVVMNERDTLTERLQPAARHIERFGVAVDPDHARAVGRGEDQLDVPPEADGR